MNPAPVPPPAARAPGPGARTHKTGREHASPPGRTDEPRWVDDFTSGSAAALAGGITTLGNMTFLQPGETPLAGLAREAEVARCEAICDFFLHPVLGETTPAVLDEIPRLLGEGCNTIKYFMSPAAF